jgi:hypothetical protein
MLSPRTKRCPGPRTRGIWYGRRPSINAVPAQTVRVASPDIACGDTRRMTAIAVVLEAFSLDSPVSHPHPCG